MRSFVPANDMIGQPMPATSDLIQTLHEICLAYPGTEEVWEGSVGAPVWKVSGKIYVMQHGVDGKPSVWIKAPKGMQEVLIARDPDRWFRPPYVGHNGWVGTWLDDGIAWPEVEDLIDDAWRMTATKTLVREFDALPKEDAGP
ncbi:MAG: MmcQ/YjbR family DNA-binding protein [Chloroflexota bacterium]|nr:MmcQ/YjbR family DNA-binding protein [Chloroflexota bacterium]